MSERGVMTSRTTFSLNSTTPLMIAISSRSPTPSSSPSRKQILNRVAIGIDGRLRALLDEEPRDGAAGANERQRDDVGESQHRQHERREHRRASAARRRAG